MKKIYIVLPIVLMSVMIDGTINTLHISVIGTGYVGLVTGACLAQLGNRIVCADNNREKIELLTQGSIPIYEIGLEALVSQNMAEQRLTFTCNVSHALEQADVIFIAVGTPMTEDGSADLSAINTVIKALGSCIHKHKTIVTKSTVPLGTGSWIRSILEQEYNIQPDLFDVVSNPEFLREGSAVADFMIPDRLIVGTESDNARAIMHTIYRTLIDEQQIPVVWTSLVSAEMIKYASNAFLALKVSFINEIANLCDASGADIHDVAHGMGLDQRIGGRFLRPGPGFGGSCFPKDSRSLIHIAEQHNVLLHTVSASLIANEIQKKIPFKKLLKLLNNNLEHRTIAVLGLAYKAGTDDIRYSPALTLIDVLKNYNVTIQVYDPAAMENMRTLFPNLTYCTCLYEALNGADAAIIMTEWDEFKHIDFNKAKKIMNHPAIVDTRNILNPIKMLKHGFIFDTIGRSYLSS